MGGSLHRQNIPVLEVTSVTKTYKRPEGPVLALSNMSLTILPGEFTVVQGPSGCGKSTLLLASGGLLRPDSGNVMINGQNVYALDSEARARLRTSAIGFVFQQFHLLPYLDVVDNILVPTIASGLPNASKRAVDLMDKLGLSHRARHRTGELSVGERQRVAIARAFVNSPSLILADEPTGNLDESNADIVINCLQDYVANNGAVLMVTHSRAIPEIARVIKLREGEVVAEERPTRAIVM